jgi:MHS family shikimate/dehydroshikimate transporter-like MFS transporter
VAMGMRVAENGAFYILTVPFFGAVSDRVGRRPLYLAGAVVTTLWAFPLFGLLNTESPVLIWLRSWSA